MNDNTKILIVEDSKAQALNLKYLLEKHNYRVLVAGDGKKALAFINEHKPSLVISDIVMPEMDGYELTEAIRKDEKSKDIPVILLSILSDPKDIMRGLEYGADNFLLKPYEEKTLFSTIRRVLSKNGPNNIQKNEEEFCFDGQRFVITAGRQKILEFLVSLYEATIQKNQQLLQANNKLAKAEKELRLLNQKLDRKVNERTARHTAEIEKREKVERVLRKKRQFLTATQLIAHIGNWVWDLKKNKLNWSDEIYRIFGLSPEKFGANNEAFLNTVHPDDRELVKKAVDEALYTKQAYSIDHRIVLPDGTERIVHEQAEVRFDGNGNPVKMIGTVQDITDLRRTGNKLEDTLSKLHKIIDGIIFAMGKVIETRDPYTAGHQRRTTSFAFKIAEEMKLSEDIIQGIQISGLIHDIGKIAVPSEILTKPGKLTEIEFELIKIHPQVGYDILKTIDFPWPVADIVLQHHERIDGSGYPNGLTGKDILIEARIIVVADVVEPMMSHRPYRPALGIHRAFEEISMNSGVHYDQEVVEAAFKVFTEKEFKFERDLKMNPAEEVEDEP